MPTLTDPHLSLVRPVTPRTLDGCEECLILGSEWVHLRLCLTCGHVGCCDSSPLQHARAHARTTSEKMSIYYAASQAEALVCAGDPVAIVGGGNSAGQAAVFLSAHATEVTLIVREHDLGEHMSRYLVDRIARIPNVHVMTSTEVRELHGEAALEAVTVTDNRTGTRRTIDARALFVFIGMAPCTGWLGGLVDLDDHGFVRTGPGSDGAERSLLETSQPGIFAVGDVRAGSAKRVATAVGEGAMAIRLAFERTRPT